MLLSHYFELVEIADKFSCIVYYFVIEINLKEIALKYYLITLHHINRYLHIILYESS
jgi:hypothetical protein